jgi:hypothetical protein
MWHSGVQFDVGAVGELAAGRAAAARRRAGLSGDVVVQPDTLPRRPFDVRRQLHLSVEFTRVGQKKMAETN